tara:strand:- start:559 stop:801 length:243 start_codon:yes stop_codon:yes gene_type:complete
MFLVLFLSAVDLYAKEGITIATGEYSPFSSISLQENDYVNHVITRAFSLEGIDVTFTFLPWKRAEHATKKRRFQRNQFLV